MIEQFGQIDIYLFDQLLKGRFKSGARVLDAGCGQGRNLVYLLAHGYDVYAADADPRAVDSVRELARRLAPALSADHFHVESVEALSFPPASMDVVISSAVLHFARDTAHFDAMLRRMWDMLRPGGMFFARLASTIGIADQVHTLGDRRFLLPDGSERFLVDEAMLEARASALGGVLLDPIKTTVVQNQRSMTTWVMLKAEC
jgi:tellurite methyltransferase